MPDPARLGLHHLIDKQTHQSKAAFLHLQPMSERYLVKRGLLPGAHLERGSPQTSCLPSNGRTQAPSFPPAGVAVTRWALPASGEELYMPDCGVCWGELRGSKISGKPLANGKGGRAPLSQ